LEFSLGTLWGHLAQSIVYILTHRLIAYGLGIRQIVVAINKMDLVAFSQTRFE
jgi:sulfate adenylyltransferase subunit 1 (EFTu-like GTPase family)